jgi:AraC-like DNA-binding protein
MLISPERVFYAGLLGRPRRRQSGGFSIYTSLAGDLRVAIDGHETRSGAIVIVPPYLAHSVESDHLTVTSLVIEPETIAPGALDALAQAGDELHQRLALRIRAAYAELATSRRRDGFTTAEFDAIFFAKPLPRRDIDPRIARAIGCLGDFTGNAVTAADCAALAGLSQSRFLHLFKDETGVAFRAFRAWKRARHMLHFVNEDINLAHLAQDIGYPDSTHFSHSIRRFYGLKPRAIFSGSRDLAIYRGDPQASQRSLLRQGRA